MIHCRRVTILKLNSRKTNFVLVLGGGMGESNSVNQLHQMKIIASNEIQAALIGFTPSKEGAYPTGRCLPGLCGSEQQEWAENITLADGRSATQFWIFENDDCTSEDAGDYPWSQEPDRIEIDDDQE